MNRLEIKALHKTYPNGVSALKGICLDIRNGMFGLLGPNGAGKSSLMKTIVGLQSPDSGEIIFNGVPVHQDPFQIKKQLGFLPQDFGVYPHISALDLLLHIAALKEVPAGRRLAQAEALLDQVNLYAERHRDVHTFSGGMRQRFGIAQALLGEPRLIIVDEPTAGLDPEERHRFNGLLTEIGRQVIVILSTHLVEDVRMLCSEMAVMHQGQILAQGSPQDFIARITGRLWQKAVEQSALRELESRYQIVSRRYNSGRLWVNVLSEYPPQDGFEPATPTLEDAYFSIVSQA